MQPKPSQTWKTLGGICLFFIIVILLNAWGRHLHANTHRKVHVHVSPKKVLQIKPDGHNRAGQSAILPVSHAHALSIIDNGSKIETAHLDNGARLKAYVVVACGIGDGGHTRIYASVPKYNTNHLERNILLDDITGTCRGDGITYKVGIFKHGPHTAWIIWGTSPDHFNIQWSRVDIN